MLQFKLANGVAGLGATDGKRFFDLIQRDNVTGEELLQFDHSPDVICDFRRQREFKLHQLVLPNVGQLLYAIA